MQCNVIVGVPFAIALLAGAPTLCGQENKQAAATDPPSMVHKQLSVLVGGWDVASRFKLGGQEFQGKAVCESKWILNGNILQQEYNTKMNGQPVTIVQYLGYDTVRQKCFEIKMQTGETGVMHNEGTMSPDGRVMTNSGDWHDPTTGEQSKLRSVTTIIDPDHYTLEWFFVDENGKEEKRVTLSHTRQKPQTAAVDKP